MSRSARVDDTPAPVEVLIPEARHHQRRRYRRSAVMASLVALLVGALIALLITTTSRGSGTPRRTPPRSAFGARHSTVLIRPVLCYAPPYAGTTPRQAGSLPPCGAPYQLKQFALDVTPISERGYSSSNIAPDPTLAGYSDSTRDSPNTAVLLGGQPPSNGGQRYLLGPSEMRLSSSTVQSAEAHKQPLGNWVVTIRLTSGGAAAWDRVAQENFHQLLAIDVGEKVVSAPLIQPTQSSFTSFNGEMEVSGAFNATAARSVAAAVKGSDTSGPTSSRIVSGSN